jgi:serine/threonine-protein kinase
MMARPLSAGGGSYDGLEVLLPGDRIGDWIVDAPLGEGGMGTVYHVHSALADRLEAAVKVLKPTAEPDARARFVREAEALSALRHPAIVRVMGFNEDPALRLLYLVMELAPGETLAARLSRGPLRFDEAVRTFLPLASALEHAHAAGIYHRDVKPGNVILTVDGGVKLVDFGIALHHTGSDTITDSRRGTLAYLPPEAFRGETPRPDGMDAYGLGAMMHEALTGTRAFATDPNLTPAANAAVIGARKLASAPLDPGQRFPEPLRDLVRRSTDRDFARRPALAEFSAVLAALAEPAGVTDTLPDAPAARAAADPTIAVADPPRPWRRWAMPAAAALLALVLAGAVIGSRRGERATRGDDGGRAGGPAVTAPPEAAPPATAPAVAAAPAEEAGGPIDMTGDWTMANVIESTSYPAYRGLRLEYHLTLRQTGRRISGEGEKVSENGQPLGEGRRDTLLVTGERDGPRIILRYVERGTQRNSSGTVTWRSTGPATLAGEFESDVAATRGRSEARRQE